MRRAFDVSLETRSLITVKPQVTGHSDIRMCAADTSYSSLSIMKRLGHAVVVLCSMQRHFCSASMGQSGRNAESRSSVTYLEATFNLPTGLLSIWQNTAPAFRIIGRVIEWRYNWKKNRLWNENEETQTRTNHDCLMRKLYAVHLYYEISICWFTILIQKRNYQSAFPFRAAFFLLG